MEIIFVTELLFHKRQRHWLLHSSAVTHSAVSKQSSNKEYCMYTLLLPST